MPPMATNYATSEGFVSDRQIAYYVERARGGVGYINVEHTGIHEQGKASPKMLMISTDEHAAKIENLVEAIHAAGGKIVVQINHAGRQTFSKAVTGSLPLLDLLPYPLCQCNGNAPRTWRSVRSKDLDRMCTHTAANRVKTERSADGVELHMAHGYLICSFLSPFSNKREDQVWRRPHKQGRARFALEVLRNPCARRVGPDFPIICRLSGDEYVEEGSKC